MILLLKILKIYIKIAIEKKTIIMYNIDIIIKDFSEERYNTHAKLCTSILYTKTNIPTYRYIYRTNFWNYVLFII